MKFMRSKEGHTLSGRDRPSLERVKRGIPLPHSENTKHFQNTSGTPRNTPSDTPETLLR